MSDFPPVDPANAIAAAYGMNNAIGAMLTIDTPTNAGYRVQWVPDGLALYYPGNDTVSAWFYVSDQELFEVPSWDGVPDHSSVAVCDPRGEDWDLCQVMYAVATGLIRLDITNRVIVGPFHADNPYDTALTVFLTAGNMATEREVTFP